MRFKKLKFGFSTAVQTDTLSCELLHRHYNKKGMWVQSVIDLLYILIQRQDVQNHSRGLSVYSGSGLKWDS